MSYVSPETQIENLSILIKHHINPKYLHEYHLEAQAACTSIQPQGSMRRNEEIRHGQTQDKKKYPDIAIKSSLPSGIENRTA